MMVMEDHFVKTKSGRVGLVIGQLFNCAAVQFGADGPVSPYPENELKYATRAEVDSFGLGGVHGKVWEER